MNNKHKGHHRVHNGEVGGFCIEPPGRWRCFLVFVPVLLLLVTGCEKFDRSKIKMPEFHFATTENLHSIAWVDAGHVWVSGNYGTILFSPDGGATWKAQDSGITDQLLGCIAFADTEKGWAAGVKATIVHTTDGGKTWDRQHSGAEEDIHDLFFLDESYGWAVGEFGLVLHTADGGKTWVRQKDPDDIYYNDVFFVDRRTGWIVGEFGTILHTKNGGATWQVQECLALNDVVKDADWDRPLPALYGIYFLDRRQGWCVGMDGVIVKTDDGGQTWSLLTRATDKPLYSIVIKGQKGWIVGNKGVCLMSHDGGATWTAKDRSLTTKFWLREISFVDDKHGMLVGARGTIAQTGDGGDSWVISSGFSYDMEEFGLADF